MNKNMAATIVLALGALILLASAFADSVGLGDDQGFGRQQTMGVIFGAVVLALGVYMRKQADQGSDNEPDDTPEA